MKTLSDIARKLTEKSLDNPDSRLCIDKYYEVIQQKVLDLSQQGTNIIEIDRLKLPLTIPECEKIFRSDNKNLSNFVDFQINEKLHQDTFMYSHLDKRSLGPFTAETYITELKW